MAAVTTERKLTFETNISMLETDDLTSRPTEGGQNIAGGGIAPLWTVSKVAATYKNAFGEQIVSLFTATCKATGEGTILDLSGITTLQFIVPDAWQKLENALDALAAYDGRWDALPAAGLGGKFGEVLERGTGVGVLSRDRLTTTHLDTLGRDYDEL